MCLSVIQTRTPKAPLSQAHVSAVMQTERNGAVDQEPVSIGRQTASHVDFAEEDKGWGSVITPNSYYPVALSRCSLRTRENVPNTVPDAQ